MKKRSIVHIIVIIAAIAGGAYLADRLNSKQMSFTIAKNASSPSIAGFNKFASDIQWMLFVNYSGSIKTVDEKNAPVVYQKLKTIINNDPSFEKAYEIGSLMLSVCSPDKAVEIIDVGCNNPQLKKNWKLPFYAGFILTHHSPDKDSIKTLDRAERYYKMAVERSNGSEKHIISQLMRIKAKKLLAYKTTKGGIRVVNEKHALLLAWYEEWKSLKANRMMEHGEFEMMSSIPDIEHNILQTAQQLKLSAPDDENILKTVELIKTQVLSGQHLCEKCLTPYAAGDKFCSKCGAQIELYGICPACNAVLKGPFCAFCGASASSSTAAAAKSK